MWQIADFIPVSSFWLNFWKVPACKLELSVHVTGSCDCIMWPISFLFHTGQKRLDVTFWCKCQVDETDLSCVSDYWGESNDSHDIELHLGGEFTVIPNNAVYSVYCTILKYAVWSELVGLRTNWLVLTGAFVKCPSYNVFVVVNNEPLVRWCWAQPLCYWLSHRFCPHPTANHNPDLSVFML